ncbi:MAG: DUF4190 domain-containing protein [Thermoplasmatota archaeon]
MAKKDKVLYDEDGFPIKKKTNELAMVSLVVSLAGLFFPSAAAIGIVLGFMALDQIKKEPHRYEGKGMAKAGIIAGFIIIGFKILVVIFYIILVIFFISLPFIFMDWSAML